ncbi:hypothetical protein GCM10023214_26100 [Amycolatopsis dongchuanensis]|uniref:Uncharacterized protein n=1 Tax=Amycolatopsis dongchuanensis TaxID=1070866 RepID=A0ABP9QFV2_9PSEU
MNARRSNRITRHEREVRRVEKHVELYLQAWTVRAPSGEAMQAKRDAARASARRQVDQLATDINDADLADTERTAYLKRLEAALAALRTQSAGKRWLRERIATRPRTKRTRRSESKHEPRISVRAVSGGLPGLGKRA